MNTLTLIDDYLDALLDGAPGALDPPAMAAVVDMLVTETDAVPVPVPSPDPLPALPPVPPPAPPTPAFVPAASAPLAAPPTAPVTAAAPAPPAAAIVSSHRWLRVTVGDNSYALELLRVQEVARLAPIVALRGADRAVLGVMNLRGRIVPVLDLGLWLDTGCVHGDERSRIVVVERDDEMIGVLVSAVEDVVTLGRERIEPPLASSDAGAIVGIARVGPAPTVLLDANALFG